MKVVLSTKKQIREISGPRTVKELLRELDIIPDTVLVICNKELLMESDVVAEGDEIEIRNVISGG
jgi:sulfur carrier protein